jgi:hypothetical protein
MSNCIDYNCSDLEDHLLNDCGEELPGGSNQMVILDCDHTVTDPTNGTTINADISAGRAILVRNVKIGMPAPSPVTVPSNIANQTDKLVNYDRSLTLIDGNINAQNILFYRALLQGRTIGGIIFYEVDANQVTWIDAAIKATGGRVFPDSNIEFQRVETTFTWRKLDEPQVYSTPTGVFS